jgi:hypothetical protein
MGYALPFKIILCTCLLKTICFLGSHTSCAVETLSKHFYYKKRSRRGRTPKTANGAGVINVLYTTVTPEATSRCKNWSIFLRQEVFFAT